MIDADPGSRRRFRERLDNSVHQGSNAQKEGELELSMDGIVPVAAPRRHLTTRCLDLNLRTAEPRGAGKKFVSRIHPTCISSAGNHF